MIQRGGRHCVEPTASPLPEYESPSPTDPATQTLKGHVVHPVRPPSTSQPDGPLSVGGGGGGGITDTRQALCSRQLMPDGRLIINTPSGLWEAREEREGSIAW